MRRVLTALAGITVAALLTSGCGQQDLSGPDATADGEEPVVGLVMKSLGNQFFQNMQDGAVAHAKKRGDLELKTVGIQSETDINGQVEAINNLVAQGVDAIVIAPADSRALIPPLAAAAKQGIKLVNIDVKLDDAALKRADLEIPFVGPDNVKGAQMVGAELAKKVGPGAKTVILEGVPGAANATQRTDGFTAAAKQGELDVVASRTAHWEADEANSVFTNLMSANPDIEAVMASNDSMALGVVAALEAKGKKGAVTVVGFDNIPEIRPLIKEGAVLATLDQFGSKQAAFGIDSAMKLLDGDKVTPWTKTPIELITADDL